MPQQVNKLKRIISINVLPGEKTDGSGRVSIHLFVQDERGPFTEPHVIEVDGLREDGTKNIVAGPARGRLACDKAKTRKVAPTIKGNVTVITPRSDDPRAVTCPKCKTSEDYARIMKMITDAQS